MLSVVIYLLVYLFGGLTLLPAILLFCWFVYVVRPSRSHSAIDYPTNSDDTTKEDRYDNKSGWIRLVTAAASTKAEFENGTRKSPASLFSPSSSTLFFAILRGGTLFCFEDEQQTTCHWILPVRNYTISLYPRKGKSEAELFGRIMSIQLAPKSNTDTAFYMTCQRPIDKEDWYFALVSASRYLNEVKDETTMDAGAMSALRGLLDGTSAQMDAQCWNAMLGRLFLGIYKTETWRQWWHTKLESKLDKLNHYHQHPLVAEDSKRSLMRLLPLQLQLLSMGDTIPCLTNATLKEFSPDGTCIIQAQLDYDGDLLVVLRTGLHTLWRPPSSLLKKKNKSSSDSTASLPLVLLLKLRHCSGKVVFKIKPPPTCRIWAAFETMPTMEWQVTPVVLDKQIKWSYVTHLLQTKIKELVAESLVMPNMEDFPFYDSGGLGGIFGQHNETTDKDSAIDVDLAKDEQQQDPPMVSTLVQGYMDRIRNPDKYLDTATSNL